MRTLVIVMGIVLVLSFAGVGSASPLIGKYVSVELGGTVLDGRWSENYVGGGPGQVGDTVHAASFNGSTLATQWEVNGPAISASPTVLLDTTFEGNGTVVYYTNYSGGSLSLTNVGPWWRAGDVGSSYAVDITSYAHTTTNEFVDGLLVASTTVVRMNGTFEDYPGYRVSFAVAAAVPTGEGSLVSAGYPGFLPTDQGDGAWGVAQKIRLEIVPEPATMGLLTAGLGLLLKRRRQGR